MYFDSLTISTLVVFAVFFGVFFNYCRVTICGMPRQGFDTDRGESEEQKRV